MKPADREKLQRLEELLRQRELAPMTNYSWWFGFWYTLREIGLLVSLFFGVLAIVWLLVSLL